MRVLLLISRVRRTCCLPYSDRLLNVFHPLLHSGLRCLYLDYPKSCDFLLPILIPFLLILFCLVDLSTVPGMNVHLRYVLSFGNRIFFLEQKDYFIAKTNFSLCCITVELHYHDQLFMLQDLHPEIDYCCHLPTFAPCIVQM